MEHFTIVKHIFKTVIPRSLPRVTNCFHDELEIVAKLYTPKNRTLNEHKNDEIKTPKGKSPRPSFIYCHGNGFPKELFEPLIDRLYESCEKSNIEINQILTIDAFNQGESCILNEKKLGDSYPWFDSSRDLGPIIHELNKIDNSFFHGPSIGIGHSMGGTTLLYSSLIYPTIFSGIIGLDAIMVDSVHFPRPAAALTLRRRDVWSDREEAFAKFKKNPFFSTWNDKVLENYVTYGLRDLPTPTYPDLKEGVTLATTKKQELITFVSPQGTLKEGNIQRPEPVYMYENLHKVPVPVQLIVARNGSVINHIERFEQEVKNMKIKESEVVIMEDVSHSLPFEKPNELAEILTPFISKICGIWTDKNNKKYSGTLHSINDDIVSYIQQSTRPKSKE